MKLKLSRKNEKLITDNVKELSLVEGNLMSAIEAQKAKGAQQINSDIQEIPSEPQSLSIYITSCLNLEGKTTSALSMAYALTVNNMKRVLLVDGNPRTPKLHQYFDTGIAPGLMDWFKSEEINRAAIVRETEYSNLFLMTFGNVADQRPDLLPSEFKEKFESLKQSFDYIIFDGDSMLESSNPALLAKNFDGIVITVSAEKTKWEVVQQAIDKVQTLDGLVLGVILNNRKYYLPNNFNGRM